MGNTRRTVALVAALDTKAADAAFIKQRIEAAGARVLLIDTGVVGDAALWPDHSAEEVASIAGTSLEELRQGRDRGTAVAAMARGVKELVRQLHDSGSIDGVFALGGGAGTTVGATAMQGLPLGVPKVILSTVAAGDTTNYLGTSDIVLFPSVVDVAGINSISQRTYGQAADAMVGMLAGVDTDTGLRGERPLVAASMFGVTTPAVLRAKSLLDQRGYEVVVFHATGAGGRTMERLCAEGYFSAVLDLTTTEWADETVGGILSAGPDRLSAAAAGGLPQVVSLGATDMVNFGRRDTLPPRFEGRLIYEHNAENTLMRTSPDEAAQIGRNIGSRLDRALGPTVVLIPDGGVSALDAPGELFEDPLARRALVDALTSSISSSNVRLVSSPLHINDPDFADLAVHELCEAIAMTTPRTAGTA
jgi:uncharacterized protein (UPF0261 family)